MEWPSRVRGEIVCKSIGHPRCTRKQVLYAPAEGNWDNPKPRKYEKLKIIKYNADGLPTDGIKDEKHSKEGGKGPKSQNK